MLMLIIEIQFPAVSIAQEEDQVPTEDFIQTEATRQPVKRIIRKRRKVSKPSTPKPAPAIALPPPPRTASSVAPVSYTVFRFSQYSGDINVGQYFMQTALNTPGSTYLLGTVALNSGSTNSTRPTNLQSFSSSLIFDGPHWNGLGLSATFNSAGAETDTGRAGLYYRLIGRIGEFGYLIVPHLLFNKSTPEIGRLLVVYNMSVLGDLLVISGSTSYTWDHEVEPMRYTVTLDPAFELKIYSTIRLVVSHSYSQSNGTERNATGFGLEFRQVF
ncbi:MAG: hypothetical protein U1E10_08690 [Bdellovibrionales bacterium]|nr:hypothetical protein [Bdellovibrionales bacterium]